MTMHDEHPEVTAHALVAAVHAVLDEPRNGMNTAFQHGMFRGFFYSDGARDLAEAAGAYWLLDIIATEAAPVLRRLLDSPDGVGTSYLEMTVADDDKALIALTVADDAPPAWSKTIDYTDFPHGQWVLFELGDFAEGQGIIAVLPSEH
jgi:hypothetical protein